MEDSQVKLDSKCSGSIGENNVEVQKKKEETFRSGDSSSTVKATADEKPTEESINNTETTGTVLEANQKNTPDLQGATGDSSSTVESKTEDDKKPSTEDITNNTETTGTVLQGNQNNTPDLQGATGDSSSTVESKTEDDKKPSTEDITNNIETTGTVLEGNQNNTPDLQGATGDSSSTVESKTEDDKKPSTEDITNNTETTGTVLESNQNNTPDIQGATDDSSSTVESKTEDDKKPSTEDITNNIETTGTVLESNQKNTPDLQGATGDSSSTVESKTEDDKKPSTEDITNNTETTGTVLKGNQNNTPDLQGATGDSSSTVKTTPKDNKKPFTKYSTNNIETTGTVLESPNPNHSSVPSCKHNGTDPSKTISDDNEFLSSKDSNSKASGVTKSAKQKKGNKSNGPPTKGSNAKWSNSKKAQEGRNPAASKKLATVHSTKGSNSSFTLSTKSNCTTKDLTIIASEGGKSALPKSFKHVHTTKRISPHVCGLRNLGNTCFMNSVLQCLTHTAQLRDFVLTLPLGKIKYKNPDGMSGEMVNSFAAFFQDMWESDEIIIVPSKVKNVLCHYASRFSGGHQEDAQECLIFFLNGLHEEVNEISRKPYVKLEVNENGKSEQEIANEWWIMYELRDKSYIVDMFYLQTKITVTCPNCPFESKKYELVSQLTLPIPKRRGSVSLRECLELFTSEKKSESINQCDECEEFGYATRNVIIWKTPPNMIIHLKRFYTIGHNQFKVDNMVEFPLTDLNLDDFCADKTRTPTRYDLYAVINHSGFLQAGHYTAYIKHNSKWYLCDDTSCRETNDNVMTSKAYVLFYNSREIYKTPGGQEKSDFSCINGSIKVPQNLNSIVEGSLSQDINSLPPKENATDASINVNNITPGQEVADKSEFHSTSDSNTNNTLEIVLENNHSPDVNKPSSPEDVTGGSDKITETQRNMPELSSTEDSNTDTTVYALEDNSHPNDNTPSFSESVIGDSNDASQKTPEITKTSSDDSIKTSEVIPESSHSSENSSGYVWKFLKWPVNYIKNLFDINDSNETQEMSDVATLPTEENATSDPNYSSGTTTQMSKLSSKEHQDSNNEKAKLEMEENHTSEVNASSSPDDSYEEEMEIPSSECSNAEKLLDIVPNDNHSNSQYNSIDDSSDTSEEIKEEYVTCHTCRSPDTNLQHENRLFFLQCGTCGSRCSVEKSGFQAVTNRRSRQQQ